MGDSVSSFNRFLPERYAQLEILQDVTTLYLLCNRVFALHFGGARVSLARF